VDPRLLACLLTMFPILCIDLDVLHKLLHQNFREMTTWEVYRSEIDSGRLEWGIVHTEKFFKENARLMEGKDGDFYVVKKLVKLVASHDEQVAAIACFDLGEFVRHYPNGRQVAKRLGAKDLVMHMIEHENAEVRRHALQCVSKMLVQNWQYVSSS
jgi:V-type H+-transporting ATPase subunit H